MSGQRYPEVFRIEAVKQVTGYGHPMAYDAARLYVTGPVFTDIRV